MGKLALALIYSSLDQLTERLDLGLTASTSGWWARRQPLSNSEFYFEFHNEMSYLAPLLIAAAESQLRDLATTYPNLVGAAVSIEKLSKDEIIPHYRVRVTPYVQPENLITEEKGESAEGALIAALDAFERQVQLHQENFDRD